LLYHILSYYSVHKFSSVHTHARTLSLSLSLLSCFFPSLHRLLCCSTSDIFSSARLYAAWRSTPCAALPQTCPSLSTASLS
jgi:hypothetical protein